MDLMLGFGAFTVSTASLNGSESDGTNIATTGFPGLTSGWISENVTLATAATTAPDGATTAASIVEDGTDNRHIVFYPHTGAAIGTFTASVYLKAFGRRYAVFQLADDGDNSASLYVDLQDGIITDTEVKNTGAISSSSIAAGANGFFKATMSGTLGAGETGDRYLIIGLSNVSTYGAPLQLDLPQYTGDGTSGVYAWRPKLVND
jgi:hypothetical protein